MPSRSGGTTACAARAWLRKRSAIPIYTHSPKGLRPRAGRPGCSTSPPTSAYPASQHLPAPRSDGRWAIGFGCHFEVGIAAERAMTELVQLYRADGRDGPPPWTAGGDERHLFAQGTVAAKDAPVADPRTLVELIDWCRDRVAAAGLEMLDSRSDQTRHRLAGRQSGGARAPALLAALRPGSPL